MAKLLLYCTKGKPWLIERFCRIFLHSKKCENIPSWFNGKIVAECECKLVERIYVDVCGGDDDYYYQLRTKSYGGHDLSVGACLSYEDLNKYFKVKINENDHVCYIESYQKGYALFLEEDSVNLFNKPKELSDYGLTKAPQNMCNVYDEHSKEWCILLSIRSKHLCQILNGEKTIEVRRKILNKLKELIR